MGGMLHALALQTGTPAAKIGINRLSPRPLGGRHNLRYIYR